MTEDIAREQYDREIAGAIGACLTRNSLTEQILYIVTTGGVPLKIPGGPRGWKGIITPRWTASSRCCTPI